jgi:cytochrome c556
MKTTLKVLAVVLLVAVLFGAAYAQFSKPDDAIKYRQAVMYLLGQHFGRMGAMVKGDVAYDKDAFAGNAAVAEMLSSLPWEAFMTPGSDSGNTTLKSSALKEKTQFMAGAETFENEITKLADAAEGDDLNAIKKQFGEAAKTCGSCHRAYRK